MTAIDKEGHAPYEVRMAALKAFAALTTWEFGKPEPTFPYTAKVRGGLGWETRTGNISNALARVARCTDFVPHEVMDMLRSIGVEPEDHTYGACAQAALKRVCAFNAEYVMPGWSQMSEAERDRTWDAWTGKGAPYRAGI